MPKRGTTDTTRTEDSYFASPGAGEYIYEFGFSNIPELKTLLEKRLGADAESTGADTESRGEGAECTCADREGAAADITQEAVKVFAHRPGPKAGKPMEKGEEAEGHRPVDFIYQL